MLCAPKMFVIETFPKLIDHKWGRNQYCHQRRMGTDMRTDTAADTSDLAEMDDPALISHWADVRSKLALTPKGHPRYTEVKRAYDAALVEYRRRAAGK